MRCLLILMLSFLLVPSSAVGLQETPSRSPKGSQPEGGERANRGVKMRHRDSKVDILIAGELFTTLDAATYKKPILYPIYAPGQTPMTRSWPMVSDAPGESRDHPHHKSLWTAHEISGIDFWAEKGGSIRTKNVESSFEEGHENAIRTTSQWLKIGQTTPILTDQTTYWFGGDQRSRWIEVFMQFDASHEAFQFDDTKEGLFAIRTHPDLRLKANSKAGVTQVFGKALNSEGITGKDVWGKKSKWLFYYGDVNGDRVGIAIFDHPSNLRHPTTWHARDYGLIAANPFGLHHFLGSKKGTGAYQMDKGDRLSLRYRIEFFKGDVTPAELESTFQQFALEPLNPIGPLKDH